MLAFQGRAGQRGKHPFFVNRARFMGSGNARRSDALSRWPFRSRIRGSTHKPAGRGALMSVQSRHWLDYDPVALVVLVVGMSAVALLALSI
jgi:hypothetical protein